MRMTARRQVGRGAVAAVLTLGFVGAQPVAGAQEGGLTDEYVVVLVDGATARRHADRVDVEPEEVYAAAFPGYVADLSTDKVVELRRDPAVRMVARNRPVEAEQVAEGWPVERFAQQVPRGIRRVGATASPTARIDGRDGQDERVDADIAVVDSGIQSSHPDLDVVGGVDCHGGEGTEDAVGHGTMVAGVAAALDNGIGVVGVAPGARLHAVRVFDDAGNGDLGGLLCGLDWVAGQAGVIDVVNMSVGGVGRSDDSCGLRSGDPLHYAVCSVVEAGVTLVAAAGNEATPVSRVVPAAYPEVVAVSGLSDTDGASGGGGPVGCGGAADDVFAPFSNFGPGVDVAAPAVCVGSTSIGGDVRQASGTSFAAPHVAGAAALVAARFPEATPDVVRRTLIDSREDVALPGDPDGANEGVLNVAGL